MDFAWFQQLSSSELAVMVGSVTLVVALAGLTLTAHRVRATTLHEQLDNGAIAGILAALIGIYAIAAGLTAVAVWGNTNDAAAKVGREATAINVLFHDFGGYPQPLRDQMRNALIDYTRYVIEQEWPKHQIGEAPVSTLKLMDDAQGARLAGFPDVITTLRRRAIAHSAF